MSSMSSSALPPLPRPLSDADVVTRLREAGCVFAEDEARLLSGAASTPAELAVLVDRRVVGEPLEHVLGWAEFCGHHYAVDPGVFVPRRRSEFLMWQAAARARQLAGAGPPGGRPVVVVDLCCGSGALGAALAAVLDRAELHAADIDPAAVRCARRNVAAAAGRVYQGDLYQPLPAALRGRVDILLANVPYVPTGDLGLLPAEARLHEARLALDGGADGLDVLRRVAAEAGSWLTPGGHLLSEASGRQAALAAQIVAGHGLAAQTVVSSEWNSAVVVGTQKGAAADDRPA
jgi:release factor glutamine methyltransferase